MTQAKTTNFTWKPARIFTQLPTEGFVHVILSDDKTEICCDVTELDEKRGDLEVLMFAAVDATYQAEFLQGQHRAIDDEYSFTVQLLKEIEDDEKAAAKKA